MLIIMTKTCWGPCQVRTVDLETGLGMEGIGKRAFMNKSLKEFKNE